MSLFCNTFVYIFEQLISFMYFKNKFSTKRKSGIVFLCFLLSFTVQYSLQFIESEYSFIFNLVSFFICNMFVLLFCYNTKIAQGIFNVVLLEGIMLTTELAVMYFISAVLHIQLTAYTDNSTIMFVETAATKALYFTVAYFISKLSLKGGHKEKANDFTMLLFILPLLSAFIIVIFGSILTKIDVDSRTYFGFTAITVMLLISNVVVFLVHEKVVSALMQNTELKLAEQKSKINKEYYQELEQQYQNSNILIHDIKRQLNVIQQLAEEENCKKINDYVKSINDDYEIHKIKRYSSDKLINVVLNRYANLCHENGIELDVDVRNADLSFISDSDLTALIDNLLENAYEAAVCSQAKSITFNLQLKNENFILINIANSCDTAPLKSGDVLNTSKNNKEIHGYGLLSVKRIVKKYHGDIDFKYSEEKKLFTVTLTLKTK